MGKVICFLFMIFSLHLSAQEQVVWMSEDIDSIGFYDSIKSVNTHSAIFPRIEKVDFQSVDYSAKKHPRFTIFPMLDMLAGNTMNQFEVRTGLGFGINYMPIKGMNFKLGYVGGIANNDLINYSGGVYPRAYFRIRESKNLIQYHDVRARLSYSPNSIFNFQIGLDNTKIGDGDRSFLLDNYGSPFPFAQIRVKFWRIEYLVMYQLLRGADGSGGYFSKYATSHYLSINAAKGFTIGLFESVVWKGKDSSQNRGYEWMYLNPILFFRPAEYSLGSSDNVLLGLNVSYKINRSIQFYGQWLLDDFLLSAIKKRDRWWATKYAIQFGIKGFSPFGLKGVSYFSELNFARPFTFSHGSTGQSYSNQSSVLAHPYGANFIELNSQIKWQKKKWDVRLNVIYLLRGNDIADSISNGGDVLKSYQLHSKEFGYTIGNGAQYHLMKTQLTVGYQLIPKWSLRAFLTAELAAQSKSGKTNYYPGIYIGVRTFLWNDKRNY